MPTNPRKRVRKHKCPVCGKTFVNAAAVKQHMVTHGAGGPNRYTTRRSRRNARRAFTNIRTVENPNGTTIRPMTSLNPNSVIHSRIAGDLRLANTAAGQAWARRALHPCDDTLGGAAPIPDPTVTATASIENRIVRNLKCPIDGFEGNWDVQLVLPSTVDLVACWRYKKSSDVNWTAWKSVDDTTGAFRPGKFQLGYDIEGEGPPVVVEPDNVYAPDLIVHSSQFRGTHRGVTVVLESSKLYDQGIVTAGQYGGAPTTDIRTPTAVNYTGTNIQTASHLLFNDIVRTSDELIYKVPQSGQWEARRGVYMPIYTQEPVHNYNGGNETTWRRPGGEPSTVSTGDIIILKPTGSDETFDYEASLVYANSGQAIVNTSAGATNHNVGVIFFEGIHSTASLRLKTRSGIEMVPTESSQLAAAVSECPMEDDAAMKMVHNVARKLPMAYEHKYNSFNWLLPLLRRAAQSIAPIAGRWFTGATGIPLS